MPDKKNKLGLEQGTVRLVRYSSAWRILFDKERANLSGAAGDLFLAIEHIGSTAIPDMEAKPIIDIAATIRTLDDVEKCVKALSSAGYEYKGEYGLPDRHFFVKGNPHTHYLHVVQEKSDHWRAWLTFRDYLRRNKQAFDEYAALKRDLAIRHSSDRTAYTKAKTEFIAAILKRAGV